MTERVDLLLEPRWLIPIEPADVTLERHAVAVRDGRIVAVLPAAEAGLRYSAGERVALSDHVLLPGLVNAHCHAAMTLLRGYADDLALMRWLSERIWPAEARLVSEGFVRDGTLLACAEMLRGGITCFSDMYFFPGAAAAAAAQMGMRCMAGIVVIDFPSAYAADADDYLARGLAARDQWRDHPLLHFAMAPHAPYTVSDRSFERIVTFAEQLELPIHIHVHETRSEIDQSLARYGVRPLERLHRLGLVGPGLIGVHAVHLLPDEIELLAAHHAKVIHCPTSNMKLASGIASLQGLLDAGVEVGLGSDGPASNNRLDLLREMRHAALLAKVSSGDATAAGAHRMLKTATLGGAIALGLEQDIGSIVPGKQADLCALRLDDPIVMPCFDPASHLIYVAGREHVSDVWVAGKPRVKDGALLHKRNSDLIAVLKLWQNELSA